ncbi:MAG: thioesterase [Bacteroidota bacterium]|nr:thioesterase [Bacteroidota bacterium]
MFEKEIELRYFEMNHLGEASPVTILTLLEETAADHCDLINHSLFDLLKQNIGWVLISGFIEMNRYPVYKEKIRIRTWLSKYKNSQGFRENIIFDVEGNIIGRAKGQWLFYDISRRRPANIFEDIKQKWSFFSEESLPYDFPRIIHQIESAKFSKKFGVQHFDVDSNKHVNNIKYLQWGLETIPPDFSENYFLNFLGGRFVKEAYYKDEILSLAEPDDSNTAFKHNIKDITNGNVCASAITKWTKRKYV